MIYEEKGYLRFYRAVAFGFCGSVIVRTFCLADGNIMKRVRDLYVWRSLSRPKHTYSWEVFATLGAIALLTSIIFSFFQEWLAILVIWAAFFLFYALTRVPPVEVDHKITTEGVVSMGHSYIWAEFGPFWFTKKLDETTLHIAHKALLGHVAILVSEIDQEKIREILAEYLPYIEIPEKSLSDKLSDFFAERIVLEKPKKSS